MYANIALRRASPSSNTPEAAADWCRTASKQYGVWYTMGSLTQLSFTCARLSAEPVKMEEEEGDGEGGKCGIV